MTPLNTVISSSQICKDKLRDHFKRMDCFRPLMSPLELQKFESVKDSVGLVRCVQQQGIHLWFTNQSHIEFMKIRKNEFIARPCWQKFPEARLENTVYPFLPAIQSKFLHVYFSRVSDFKGQLSLDWQKYELIVFNIIQNAIKYNQFMGSVVVMTDLYRDIHSDANGFVFETTIVDNGKGIPADRHHLLFRPFQELKSKQDLKKVSDGNIGMGLASSYAITKALGGKLRLLQSQQGLTVFRFKLPVEFQPAGWRHDQLDLRKNLQEMKFLKREVGLGDFSQQQLLSDFLKQEAAELTLELSFEAYGISFQQR